MKKKIILYCLLGIAIAALLIVPLVLSKWNVAELYASYNIAPFILYGSLIVISVGVIIFYTLYFKQKNIWFFLVFISIAVCNVGYFAFSLSTNTNEILLANNISYFGNVFLLLFVIFIINDILRINIPFWCKTSLFCISLIMFIFSATTGFCDLFYVNPTFVLVDGFATISKSYGIGHTIYLVYIGCYVAIIAFMIIKALIKHDKYLNKVVWLLVLIALLNVAIWFIEMAFKHHIEYLAVSYVIGEIIFLYIYNYLVKHKVFNNYVVTLKINETSIGNKTIDLTVNKNNQSSLLNNKVNDDEDGIKNLPIEQIRDELSKLPEFSKLTDRELDVATLLLKDLKRKEMAKELYVSEDTIKTHTSHIFRKIRVSSRDELSKKLKDINKK